MTDNLDKLDKLDKLNVLQDLAIPFPITASFRQQARAYAAQYFAPNIQQRMYLHTLAVFVADAYFRILGFQTNLNRTERWNAIHRLWSEANELELLGLGNLECCVIAKEQEKIILPSDIVSNIVRHNIGYLFIEITESEKEAVLLGFLPAFDTKHEELEITDLQSMDALIDYLSEKETSLPVETAEIDEISLEFTEKKITYLRNWLNNIYEGDWQPATRNLRNAICNKNISLAGQIFKMQLSISQPSEELVNVIVTIQSENTFLPIGMQVSVPDESHTHTETVDEAGDLIKIPLELSPSEKFWVELRIGESFIREYFIA
ncbi:hypothetical protein SR1949_19420 [Sphaerospermopsis reniformis]|uniref:DUF1822 domain-containing protein n=1 Tax=Sphaerospermopsis reniformis TaxID=531300 RepID=A0A479ZZ29_9CYAN|nr:DUF1822 family protein [Sphaerospermopsis reniformis]GCL36836.1 hypothetical protein SR1949_19420 [Sphaerospermopsis reniformis]